MIIKITDENCLHHYIDSNHISSVSQYKNQTNRLSVCVIMDSGQYIYMCQDYDIKSLLSLLSYSGSSKLHNWTDNSPREQIND